MEEKHIWGSSSTKLAALVTAGKSFCFAGKLVALTRAEAKARVEEMGGVVKSAVAADLDYLIVGDVGAAPLDQAKKGRKIVAAEKLLAAGAPLLIISEADFVGLVRHDAAGSKKKAKKKEAKKKATARSGGAAVVPTVGRKFCFAGKLVALTRAEAAMRVKELGGVARSAVAKDLDYLVVGDEGSPLLGQGKKGSKIVAAEKLIAAGAALKIISESAFMVLTRAG